MLVAAPNDTDTTDESKSDPDNDYAEFIPSSHLEKQLLEATVKPRKEKKEEGD